MKKKILWLILACLMVIALLLASCRPAAVPEEGKRVVGKVVEKEVKVVEKVKEEVAPAPEGPQYGGTITLSTKADPPHLDPYYDCSAWSGIPMSLYYERLGMADWSVDRNKVDFRGYVPMQYWKGLVAEKWEMPDPLTVVMYIRKGIRWHDKPPVNGRELTASDVEYTFHRMLGLGSGFTKRSAYRSQENWGMIKSVTATEKYKVVLELSREEPFILENLFTFGCNDYIVPREVVQKYGDLEDWRNAVGTGPFILADLVKGGSFTFTRNPGYWGWDELHPANKIPYVDKVVAPVIPDSSTEIAALRTGKIDLLGGIDSMQAESLNRTNPELMSQEVRSTAHAFYFRNDLAPFTDIRVRRALQMAIDLEEITKTYYRGKADPLPSMVNKGVLGVWAPLEEYPKEVKEAFTYNPQKAKQLLTEAGYPNGFKTSVMISSDQPGAIDLAELTVGYWKAIGVELEIKVLELAAFIAAGYGRKFEGLCWLVAAHGGSPRGAFFFWYPGIPYNIGNVTDPVFKQKVDAYKSNPDADERTRLAREANIYGTSQHYYIGFPVPYLNVFWQPWLKGYNGEATWGASYQLGLQFARIWVDQDLKSRLTR